MALRRSGWLLSLLVVWLSSTSMADVSAQTTAATQSVLGPGLYVFQTRTRHSTCGDSDKDGYVMSYLAAIHGIPASVRMTMELTNTPHFKEWALVVEGDKVKGSSKMGTSSEAPVTTFEVSLAGDRFKGTGARHYYATVDGKKQRCSVEYDTLLRRLDL